MRSLLQKPLLGFTVLLAFQWIGEFIVRLIQAPIPGPVVGMVLLFLALLLYRRVPAALDRVSQGLLANLALLFVPAAVGAALQLAEYRKYLVQFMILIALSTLITMAVTAFILRGREHE